MGRMRYGTNPLLEGEANRLIRESLKGVTKHCEKADILTPWKEAERRRREVYPVDGVADSALRRGMFHRVANTSSPHLNSREGVAPPLRGGSAAAHSSLSTFASDFRDP